MTAKTPLLIATLLLAPAVATADCSHVAEANPATISLRVDNDVWGGAHQDQGYSYGGNLQMVSPHFTRGSDDCTWAAARGFDRVLGFFGTDGATRNVAFALTHAIYTPIDKDRTDLIVDDRPYAAVATLAATANARAGEQLRTTQLRLGIVGPSARGQELQDAIHGLWARGRFQGWEHQLDDEPVVQLTHERVWRWQAPADRDGWGWDHTLHAGAALGNLATHANFGGEVRFGWKLPDDFVSSPLRPGGDGIAPALQRRTDDWAWHVYASLDNRLVAQDVSLDGNTWKDSHSVDKKPYVADLTLGFVLTKGPWRFAATHTRRSREFDGQEQAPVFGTFSLGLQF